MDELSVCPGGRDTGGGAGDGVGLSRVPRSPLPAGAPTTSGRARPSAMCRRPRTSRCAWCSGACGTNSAGAIWPRCCWQRASPSRTKPSGRGRIASPHCARTACVTSGGARLAYGDTWIKPSPWPLSAACSRPTGTKCARCRRPHRHDQTHNIAGSRPPQRDGAPNPDTS